MGVKHNPYNCVSFNLKWKPPFEDVHNYTVYFLNEDGLYFCCLQNSTIGNKVRV